MQGSLHIHSIIFQKYELFENDYNVWLNGKKNKNHMKVTI